MQIYRVLYNDIQVGKDGEQINSVISIPFKEYKVQKGQMYINEKEDIYGEIINIPSGIIFCSNEEILLNAQPKLIYPLKGFC